jgi:predicted dithiol-disulfide oxidoreductase (DUF899 family)
MFLAYTLWGQFFGVVSEVRFGVEELMADFHSFRFPGEAGSYREARNRLLQAEIDLRRRVEEVAALRRQLPLGGKIPEDYVFEVGPDDLNDNLNDDDTKTVRQISLSQLFRPGKDALAIYSLMYGPKMKAACPMCSSIVDALNGTALHAEQRMNLAIVAKSPLARIRTLARERGWNHLRLLSSADNNYNRDYYGENAEGGQQPSLNVFVRRGGKIHHSWHSELVLAAPDAGQNQRHIDMMWPLWNLLDFTPEGRGADWYPSLSYHSL